MTMYHKQEVTYKNHIFTIWFWDFFETQTYYKGKHISELSEPLKSDGFYVDQHFMDEFFDKNSYI